MKRKSPAKPSRSDWKRVDAMRDEDIDTTDIPEVTPEQFARAVARVGLKPMADGLTSPDFVATISSCGHIEDSAMEVSVRELKNHLSEYLRRAQAGEEIVVTSRGKPVGRLLGPSRKEADPEASAVARLKAQPWVRPGNGEKLRGSHKPVTVPAGTTEELMHWVRGE